MGDPAELTASAETSIADIGREAWDACANPPSASRDRKWRYPFLSFDFLEALERSGCASAKTGWLGQHLVLRTASGEIVAVCPCYLKNHSFGEYVFDHAWADAFERAGGRYYPKLQAAVPFTPVTSPRILVRDGFERPVAERALASAAIQITGRLDASSLHLTFLPEDEWTHLGALGLLQRTGKQFRWPNRGYGTFDDFLSALSSRKRKTIRKERARALESGIEVELVTGADLAERHWDAFFDFYMDTGARKWGHPYLNRAFFSLISERMAGQLLLVLARRAGRYIAGALNIIGADTLFGRYWGAIEYHECLHFELCFYQAIDFAIAEGIQWVEAGAGGQHKLARGYLPMTTYSAHYVAHKGLRRAIADYLDDERNWVELEQRELGEHAPYRHGDGG
jgi:predicted N-acyltransferase